MSNCLFSYVNEVDGSLTTLTASDTAGDLSADNMAHPIVGRRWRTTDLTAHVDVDFGADKTVQALALVFPRDVTLPGGTVTHTLDADGGTAGAGVAYDSGALTIADAYGYHVTIIAAAKTARYWRIALDASGVSFVDIGRAWAGAIFQPASNWSYPFEDAWRDLSALTVAPRSGAEFPDERPRQRALAFTMPALSSADALTMREMRRTVGVSKQLLFVKDPSSASKETILGRLEEASPIIRASFPLHATQLRIRESL